MMTFKMRYSEFVEQIKESEEEFLKVLRVYE